MAISAFGFTGALQIFTVPAGVNSVTIRAVGAAGGSFTGASAVAAGGLGASAQGIFAVNPGEELAIVVGEEGDSSKYL